MERGKGGIQRGEGGESRGGRRREQGAGTGTGLGGNLHHQRQSGMLRLQKSTIEAYGGNRPLSGRKVARKGSDWR